MLLKIMKKKNIDSQGDNSLIKKGKRQFQENNLEMDIDKKEIIFKDMNDNIDVKKAIPVAGEIVEKTESANPVVKESSIEIRNKDIKKNAAIEKDDISVKQKQSNDSEKLSINEENIENKNEINLIESAKSSDDKNIIIQEKVDKLINIEIKNNNIKQIFSDYSLEKLLNFIKKKSEEFKKDEKEIKLDQDKIIEKDENKILNLVLPIFQIYNRFNLIVQQLVISKNTIKEIEAFQLSQKVISENKIEIEKFLIEINMMNSFIELLKTPSIVIVKRKLLDLIIYSIIKVNKDKFSIDNNYCPSEYLLKKILKKIEKYSENILRKDDIEKINESKKKIKELINKNQSTIKFPLSCSDKDLDIIVDYLNFCKGKYNKVVHVSEEAVKYYLYLAFFDKTESKFKELFSLIKNEKENKSMDSKKNNNAELNSQNILGEEEKENKQDGKDESEINSKYSRPLKINIDIALENFVKDNLIENDDLQLKKS